ncbi:RNA polymerase sigma factor [Pedobacter agri]|uniref:RNA polymerase sigma factor n=1 Tax=Pedobacter agri TaxID=454586 RepID=UPI002930DBB7|nr:sigma-70 family RNA polymerase sigma factor [Pedobacter agri]
MISKIDERELFMKISEGDEDSFALFFNEHISNLESFVTRYTKSIESTQEVIQNSFVRLWLNRDKLADIENPKAYLYKYVTNECLSHLKKSLRKDQVMADFGTTQEESTNHVMESMYVSDIRKIISSVILHMPAKRRQIYELSRVQGKSIPEIALALDLSPNTVKNTLVTALKNIKDALKDHGISINILILIGML